MYLAGGLATLITLTYFGRLADRFGKLLVFRWLAAATVVSWYVVTNLPSGLSFVGAGGDDVHVYRHVGANGAGDGAADGERRRRSAGRIHERECRSPAYRRRRRRVVGRRHAHRRKTRTHRSSAIHSSAWSRSLRRWRAFFWRGGCAPPGGDVAAESAEVVAAAESARRSRLRDGASNR